jgi:hypothetical protein
MKCDDTIVTSVMNVMNGIFGTLMTVGKLKKQVFNIFSCARLELHIPIIYKRKQIKNGKQRNFKTKVIVISMETLTHG